jgi:hypothetical protein
MTTYVNLLSLWPESFGQNHQIWKNLKVQFSIDQMLNGEIEKKKSIIQKGKKKRSNYKQKIKSQAYSSQLV